MKPTCLLSRLSLPLAAVCLAAASAPSAFAQQAVSINFNNRSQELVDVFWVNPQGQEVKYHSLKPNDAKLQMTYVGHVWIFRNAAGQQTGRLTAERTREYRFDSAPNPAGNGGATPRPAPAQPVPGAPIPQPQPQPRPQAVPDAKAEATKAIERLNAIRANPAQFRNLSASLADADVQPRPALVPNKALQAAAERKAQWMAQNERADDSHFAHVITINGEKIGMNKWMREAGFKLAPFLKDEDTNFECLHYDGGFGVAGIGQRTIDGFMAEGKDGGHVLPTLGRGFWAPCKDIGVGVATSQSGKTYVSVLVGIYNPFQPDQTGE